VSCDKNGDLVATDMMCVLGQHSAQGGITVEFIDTTNQGVMAVAATVAANTVG
jgi:hypothetical protein